MWEKLESPEENPPISHCHQFLQLVQINWIMSSTSTVENPVRVDILFLTSRRSCSRLNLHASELGTGQYFILFLTRVLEGNCFTGKPWPHSRVICLRFLPETVLWSCWTSLARNLTGNLLHFSSDCWNPAYLLHIMTLGWRLSGSFSIKYLSTLKQILMATFHALNILSHSFENRSQRLDLMNVIPRIVFGQGSNWSNQFRSRTIVSLFMEIYGLENR